MPRIKDLSNRKFTLLTAVAPLSELTADGCRQWNCVCDCGKEKVVKSTHLLNGHTKSCGCLHKKDLTGRIFGRLTAKFMIGSVNKRQVWSCICECGKLVEASSNALLMSNTRSCGCLKIGSRAHLPLKTHCNQGHEFTEENTYIVPKTGARHCRVCKAEWVPEDLDKYKTVAQKAQKRWRDRNPDYWRKHHLKHDYGMTEADYDAKLLEQDGKCAICFNIVENCRTKNGRLHVDHCHTTGKIRALLCFPCNSAIGFFGDDTTIMKSAISYIEKHK